MRARTALPLLSFSLALFAVSLAPAPALARPGFYIGVGIGPGFTNGEIVDLRRVGGGAVSSVYALRTTMGTAPAAQFRLGFNILGYAAIEALTGGQATSVFDPDARNWAASWGALVRVYPMWHWQADLPEWLQPLEPSIFAGLGMTWAAYVPNVGVDQVGWRGPVGFRGGVGVEYFIVSLFKLGIDYQLVTQSFDTFIYNQTDGIEFDTDPPASNVYHQLLFQITFHFDTDQKAVRYDNSDRDDRSRSSDDEPQSLEEAYPRRRSGADDEPTSLSGDEAPPASSEPQGGRKIRLDDTVEDPDAPAPGKKSKKKTGGKRSEPAPENKSEDEIDI